MTHSDDDGLVLPPRTAPVKAVVLPISTDEDKLASTLLPRAEEISASLDAALGGRYTTVDRQFHLRPGDRFFHHLQKGVPFRIELGEREMAEGKVRVVRRDTGERFDIPTETLANRMTELLEEMQIAMLDRAIAFRRENTSFAASYDEFKAAMAEKGGFIETYFAGTTEDERVIKEDTGASSRCMPLESDDTGTCMFTGKSGARRTIFAKAY